jgi:DNA adenine methylase
VRYVGGKARIAKWIRDHILAVADDYRGMRLTYVEPFVGSGAVLEQVAPHFERVIANDIHPDLIRMWYTVCREEWEPPACMSEQEYRKLQSSNIPSPLRGFAGFCFSFGGKWMSGFESRIPQQRHERISVLRRARKFRHAQWKNTSYMNLAIPPGSIVFCDPPYIDTGKDCYAERLFDHVLFWKIMDEWVVCGSIVFVSEYTAPASWSILDEHPRHSILGTSTGQKGDVRTEKLFMRRP